MSIIVCHWAPCSLADLAVPSIFDGIKTNLLGCGLYFSLSFGTRMALYRLVAMLLPAALDGVQCSV